MVISRALKCVGAIVLFSAVIFAPTAAMTQDGDDMQSKAISTRQGLMKLVLLEKRRRMKQQEKKKKD